MTDCWDFKNCTDVAGSWVFVGLISSPGGRVLASLLSVCSFLLTRPVMMMYQRSGHIHRSVAYSENQGTLNYVVTESRRANLI